MKLQHYPVMNKEVLALLAKTSLNIILDCTLGAGGHALKILENFPQCRLIGIDIDPQAIALARNNLLNFENRCRFICCSFEDIFSYQQLIPFSEISAIIVDPGLSMWQIKESNRGFSHSKNEFLDMRKSPKQEPTAFEIINHYSFQELNRIFLDYGELNPKASARLCQQIIEQRLQKKISTTAELRQIIERVFYWKPQKGKTHPAAPVFQALRIFINRELERLEEWLLQLPDYFRKQCRLIFLTYHSLEDRIVKKALKRLEELQKALILKPFPLKPSSQEIRSNPPSRSAKLRACEFLG